MPWDGRRDPAVDLVRGIAVVCMVIAHVRVWSPFDSGPARLVLLLVRLRRTGMSVADMETFMDLLAQGTATHGRRRALLDRHRTEVLARMEQVRADLEAIDAKIAHYDRLIAAGLDCGETP